MTPKTARRWLARNKWRMAKARIEWEIGRPKDLWNHFWLCLSLTEVLFRRFDLGKV